MDKASAYYTLGSVVGKLVNMIVLTNWCMLGLGVSDH